MTDFLLDTDTFSHLVKHPRGQVAKLLRALPDGAVAISTVTAGEARFGYMRRGSRSLAEGVQGVLEAMPVLPIQPPADEIYAEVRAGLERAGKPIGGNDLWIAAHALALGCTLVTANEREFRRVPGLKVENWLA